MNRIRPIPKDRAAWLKLRQGYIGGSESAALHGFNPDYGLSRFALWHIKQGLAEDPFEGNERTDWGVRLERVIAEAVCAREDWILYPGVFASIESIKMSATLDFLVRRRSDPTMDGKPNLGVLQIKNVDRRAYMQHWTDKEPPAWTMIQLQHEIAAYGGATWGAVGALVGGNTLEVVKYDARPRLIDAIKGSVQEFWQSIAEQRPPPPDGHDSTSEVLRQLWRTPNAEILDLSADNEFPEICARHIALGEQVKVLKEEQQAARNQILAKLGGHRAAKTNGFIASLSVGEDKPDRLAVPGEVISGRRGQQRLTLKNLKSGEDDK